jgi:peroxiredoxin
MLSPMQKIMVMSPEFTLANATGEEVQLSDYLKKDL